MAILPIDLQTLYTQLDKIGKSQVQQQQMAHAAREQDMAKNIRKADERLKTVHTVETDDESIGVVHDRESTGEEYQSAQNQKPKTESETTVEEEKEIIRDPSLGKHIDISG